MGLVHERKGEHRKALESFLRALGVEPSSPAHLSNAALAHARVGEYGEAILLYDRIVAAGGREALLKRGLARARLGQSRAAIEDAESWRIDTPCPAGSKGQALYDLACLYALAYGAATKEASERDGELSVFCLERAIQSIEDAFANGYQHFEWLSKDSDLDAIRAIPRFQKIIEGRMPGTPEPAQPLAPVTLED
jgi:tetratricopeptide (TPR) repeat protein